MSGKVTVKIYTRTEAQNISLLHTKTLSSLLFIITTFYFQHAQDRLQANVILSVLLGHLPGPVGQAAVTEDSSNLCPRPVQIKAAITNTGLREAVPVQVQRRTLVALSTAAVLHRASREVLQALLRKSAVTSDLSCKSLPRNYFHTDSQTNRGILNIE